MEELILTKEQKKDFGKSLVQKMKEYLNEIFHSERKIEGKELREELLGKTKSDEERETLQMIFDEIDLAYQKRKEFTESHKDIVKWQEEELERIAKEVAPNASREDVDVLKTTVIGVIDVDIQRYSEAVDEIFTNNEQEAER